MVSPHISVLVSTFLSKRNHPRSLAEINLDGSLSENYFAVKENRINNLIIYYFKLF
jgi:hypothetical protein|tara:strand:+ start:139 stop:306 length:168 start_codon:yes stop_codon:yes gene_type:complete